MTNDELKDLYMFCCATWDHQRDAAEFAAWKRILLEEDFTKAMAVATARAKAGERFMPRPGELMAKNYKGPLPKKYVVRWWTKDDKGYRYVHESDHTDLTNAKHAFKAIPKNLDPELASLEWSEALGAWQNVDLRDLALLSDEQRELNRKGAAAVRMVLGGKDSPDLRADKLRGHDHHKGAEDCPVCARRKDLDDPATCPVCDALCAMGLTPFHPEHVD